MKKILIVGSNFGSKVYLTALMKYYKQFEIYICSPNIHKKKFNKKISIYSSFETALLENKIDFVICATTPIVQLKVLNFIYKNKFLLKGILLEKPVSITLAKTKKSKAQKSSKETDTENIDTTVFWTSSNNEVVGCLSS